MSQNVEQLAQSVYGEGVRVLSQELGPDLVQVAAVHPQGIPLVLVTARSEDAGRRGVAAALEALKAGG